MGSIQIIEDICYWPASTYTVRHLYLDGENIYMDANNEMKPGDLFVKILNNSFVILNDDMNETNKNIKHGDTFIVMDYEGLNGNDIEQTEIKTCFVHENNEISWTRLLDIETKFINCLKKSIEIMELSRTLQEFQI